MRGSHSTAKGTFAIVAPTPDAPAFDHLPVVMVISTAAYTAINEYHVNEFDAWAKYADNGGSTGFTCSLKDRRAKSPAPEDGFTA